MHSKDSSDMTSLTASSPPPSPARQPVYYVTSPVEQSHRAEGARTSFGTSSLGTSPLHPHNHRYASSPIDHSRESSTTRISGTWRKLHHHDHHDHHTLEPSDDEDEYEHAGSVSVRCYVVWFVLGFVLLFTAFSLILWGVSKSYKPNVHVTGLVFHDFNLQAGIDLTGVPTKMISINSTVNIAFRNTAVFFGVHVSSTPLDIYYSDLNIATGSMEEFYLSRKKSLAVKVEVGGRQVPVYGAGSSLRSRAEDGGGPVVVPLQLHFTVRARAYVLGHLVKTKFYRRVRCSFQLSEDRLGKPVNLVKACEYHE
ncbi:hypothetical protein Cni_G25592 [Canna indica]|uniref:Late embryogenesis abundant protein LEA-2 subgroup domain-containing protein n=1 Tax=Canna indica TaxID=4628 RepID=A0AAQ3KXY0_9LILI|nr:hypothetical protein Cni_G25592 [Canna indica]